MDFSVVGDICVQHLKFNMNVNIFSLIGVILSIFNWIIEGFFVEETYEIQINIPSTIFVLKHV